IVTHGLLRFLQNSNHGAKPCVRFTQRGYCKYGDSCIFLHVPHKTLSSASGRSGFDTERTPQLGMSEVTMANNPPETMPTPQPPPASRLHLAPAGPAEQAGPAKVLFRAARDAIRRDDFNVLRSTLE
ncbi:hypothetical protein VaNZ11_011876, partial [Volvox africanus]